MKNKKTETEEGIDRVPGVRGDSFSGDFTNSQKNLTCPRFSLCLINKSP